MLITHELAIWMNLCLIGTEVSKDQKALFCVHSWGLSAAGNLCRDAGQEPNDLLMSPVLASVDTS